MCNRKYCDIDTMSRYVVILKIYAQLQDRLYRILLAMYHIDKINTIAAAITTSCSFGIPVISSSLVERLVIVDDDIIFSIKTRFCREEPIQRSLCTSTGTGTFKSVKK